LKCAEDKLICLPDSIRWPMALAGKMADLTEEHPPFTKSLRRRSHMKTVAD
jgi:hypothetical protein